MTNLGLIETIKVINGKMIFKDLHVNRLTDSLNTIGVKVAAISVEDRLLRLFKNECLDNKLKDFRLRIEIQKNRMNDYMPQLGDLKWNCTIKSLDQSNLSLNKTGLSLSYLPNHKKILDVFKNLKHTERSIYTVAMLYAKEHHLDDAIVLNEYNRIADTSICNLFIIKDNVLFTPSLSEGPVRGVFRDFIVNNTSSFKVIQTAVTINDIDSADGIFITNAIRGMRWVEYIDDKRYSNQAVLPVVAHIESLMDRYN